MQNFSPQCSVEGVVYLFLEKGTRLVPKPHSSSRIQKRACTNSCWLSASVSPFPHSLAQTELCTRDPHPHSQLPPCFHCRCSLKFFGTIWPFVLLYLLSSQTTLQTINVSSCEVGRVIVMQPILHLGKPRHRDIKDMRI